MINAYGLHVKKDMFMIPFFHSVSIQIVDLVSIMTYGYTNVFLAKLGVIIVHLKILVTIALLNLILSTNLVK